MREVNAVDLTGPAALLLVGLPFGVFAFLFAAPAVNGWGRMNIVLTCTGLQKRAEKYLGRNAYISIQNALAIYLMDQKVSAWRWPYDCCLCLWTPGTRLLPPCSVSEVNRGCRGTYNSLGLKTFFCGALCIST